MWRFGSWYLKIGANPHRVRPQKCAQSIWKARLACVPPPLNPTRVERTELPRTTSSLPPNPHPPHPPLDPEVRSCDPEVCSFDPEDMIHLGHPSTAITYLHGVHARTIVPSLHTSTHIQPPHTRVHARSHVTTQGRSENDRAHTHTSPRARRTPLRGVCEAPGSISPRSCGPHPVRHGFVTETRRNFRRAHRHPRPER